jgi:O-antigen/teichoic acid export membrane protein
MKLASLSRKLLSASALQLGNLLLAAMAALLVMPMMVHHFGDRLYGLWSLAAAFIGYYTLLDLGLSMAVGQYLCVAIGKKDEVESEAVFNHAFWIQTALGLVAAVITAALAFCSRWLCRSPEDASLCWKVIAILGTTAALSFPVRVYRGLLEAELRVDLRSALDLFALILRTGLTVWVVLANGGLLLLAWVNLFASLPALILQVWLGRREASWARIKRMPLARTRMTQLFSYSMYAFGSSIADILRFQVDALVISAIIGMAAVTHYRIATVFSNYYIQAIIALASLFQPVMSRLYGAGDRSGLNRVFFFATKASLSLSVFICGAVIFWGRPFIGRWMGVRYQDAYLPMVILAIAVFFDVVQGASVGYLYSIFKHRSYAYLNAAEGVINLVCSLALARPLGIVGVALGTLIGSVAIRAIVQPVVVCRAGELSYSKYLRFLGMNLLGCGAIMGGTAVITKWAIRPSYPWLITSSTLAFLIYAVAVLLLIFTPGERSLFIEALTKRKVDGDSVTTTPLSPSEEDLTFEHIGAHSNL